MASYISVRVKPKAQRNQIYAILMDGTYKIRINESPEKGRANKSLLKYLSKIVGIPHTSFKIISGAGSRQKIIEVQGIRQEQLENILYNALHVHKDFKNDSG